MNVTGGIDLTLFEVNEAMSIIHESADEEAAHTALTETAGGDLIAEVERFLRDNGDT